MTDYLKQFIERATDVPMQLRRRLALLRDLDEKAVQLHREIDEQYKKLLVEKSQTASKRQKGETGEETEVPPTFDLELQLKKLIGLSDDKVRNTSPTLPGLPVHTVPPPRVSRPYVQGNLQQQENVAPPPHTHTHNRS